MSAPSAANGAWRGTLRRVLRAVDAHVTPHTGSQTWRDHVLAEFRSNRDTMALADRVAARLRAADEWATLANAVQRHKAMIMDYGQRTLRAPELPPKVLRWPRWGLSSRLSSSLESGSKEA